LCFSQMVHHIKNVKYSKCLLFASFFNCFRCYLQVQPMDFFLIFQALHKFLKAKFHMFTHIRVKQNIFTHSYYVLPITTMNLMKFIFSDLYLYPTAITLLSIHVLLRYLCHCYLLHIILMLNFRPY
jgi:hypothetical protein